MGTHNSGALDADKRGELEKLSKLRVYTAKPITIGRGICFGLVDLMGGGWNTIISGLLLYFFTNYGGVTATQGGLILGVARIVDAVISVFIGPLTDGFYRTKLGRRFGRRHFFLMIGAPLLLIIFPLLWIPFGGFWYYLVIYLLIEVIIAIILIPWETLPTEMTRKYEERTTLSSMRMFCSATGTFVVFFIPALVRGNVSNPWAYLGIGGAFAVLFAIGVFTTYATTWERPLTPEFVEELDAMPKMNGFQMLKHTAKEFTSVFRNSSYNKHLTVYLFSFTGKDVYASALTFFAVYAVGMSESQGFWLQAVSIVGIPMTIWAMFLMLSHGPRFLWAFSFTLILASLAGVGAIYLIGPESNAFIYLLATAVIYQCGRALLEYTPWNVYPFIPDVDYIMTREDRAGIYAAVMTFGRKSTGALGTFLVGWFMDLGGFVNPLEKGTNLAASGYTPLHEGACKVDASGALESSCQVVQSAGASHMIAFVTVILPAILIGVALLVSRFVKLDKRTHAILMDEIHRLEAGGAKEDATPEARKVAEDLTGHSWDELWPEVPLSQR